MIAYFLDQQLFSSFCFTITGKTSSSGSSSSFEEHLNDDDTVFDDSVDGWTNTNSGETIELRDDSTLGGDAVDGQKYIELNTDSTDTYNDASSISRSVDTVEGATYELDFNFSARPGYDEGTCQFEIVVDGQTVGTYSADGSGNDSVSWNNDSVSFTGTGNPVTIEFKETGSDNPDYGRGMFLDDISLTQSVTTTQTQDLTTDEDSALTVDVLGNDSDSDGGTLSISEVQGQNVSSGQSVNVTNDSGTVIGTAQVVSGKIVFTPGDELDSLNDGENQDVTFGYTISDGQGGTDSANVTINVTGITDNVSPDATDDTGTSETITITETGTDITNLGDIGNNDVDGDGYLGFVHNAVIKHHLEGHDDPEDIELYFCGPPLMNQAVLKMADDWGIPDENVAFDDFGG